MNFLFTVSASEGELPRKMGIELVLALVVKMAAESEDEIVKQ